MIYLLLYLPFFFSYLTSDTPVLSYGIAWLGSAIILWTTVTGRVKPLPEGKPFQFQLFRPLVFTQVVFAGYTSLTSIFFFLEVTQRAASGLPSARTDEIIRLAAQAQSLYVLGHAAMVTGILLFMDYRDSGRFRFIGRYGAPRLLFGIAATFLVLSILGFMVPQLQQVTLRLRQIAMVASVFSFALSIVNKEGANTSVNAAVFGMNFILALMSGWKEEVLVLFLLFLAAIFPYYRRAATTLGVICIALFVTILPAYTTIYRSLAWYGDVDAETAMKQAYQEVRSGSVDLRATTSSFATDRLSEINLFVKYLERVPSKHPFYGMQIINQTLRSFIPRFAWPDKPNTEKLVMERVYENRIVNRASRISAKPQFIVDAYLVAGIPGILLAGLLYGALASVMSRLAERWFGGYTLGSGLIYAALFQVFWRGNSFEFFFPTLFWSFLLMVALFQIGWRLKLFATSEITSFELPSYRVRVTSAPEWQKRTKRIQTRTGSGPIQDT